MCIPIQAHLQTHAINGGQIFAKNSHLLSLLVCIVLHQDFFFTRFFLLFPRSNFLETRLATKTIATLKAEKREQKWTVGLCVFLFLSRHSYIIMRIIVINNDNSY